MRTLVTVDGQLSEVSADDITRRLLADEGEFWLDVERPEDADYDLLLDAFGFHPLTVEDVRQQNQRPKLVQFAGYAFAVLFTITLRDDQMDFREHHLYLSKRCLVSVHQEPAPDLEDLRRRIRESPELTRGEGKFLQYLVANALVESLFPTLDGIDVTIDELEDGIVQRATPATLIRLTTLRHQVSDLRRVVSPQREVFQRLVTHSLEHGNDDLSPYWRDVHDHLVRQHEQVDSLRDLLSGTMDVYLSTVSNRLNRNMQQLTVITSVFLPMTFITGFFGMNFPALVHLISGPGALAVGVGLMVMSLGVQLYLFRLRGWI